MDFKFLALHIQPLGRRKMRRLIAVALGLFVALSVAIPASAATSVDTIVGALQKAPVFVVDGTEGTTSDTAAALTGKLDDGDNIVIVMLPADETLSVEDVNALAQKISNGLKDERIVGIAVGAQFAGAASMLPTGTANDLMNRADTVSTSSVETLITFIRNVHDWQRSNPDYIPTPKPEKAVSAVPVWPFIVGAVVILVTITLVVFLTTRRRIRGRVHYTAPGNLNDPVRSMMDYRKRLERDRYWDTYSPPINAARKESVERMFVAIDATCRYTEAYFKRFASEKKNDGTLTIFNNQLELAQKVVKDYVYTYENAEFVDNPIQVMKRGHDAIEGLAETILSSIKKGNNDRLMDYKVSTNILDAQRYKDPRSSNR
jgi:hypothetical protein